jgi:hypothetical protein
LTPSKRKFVKRLMVSLHAEPTRIWPALLAHHIFNQTCGAWIVGLLAVVLVTAKLHDVLTKTNRRKIRPDDRSSDCVKSPEIPLISQKFSQIEPKTSDALHIDRSKMNHVDFFCALRSSGFNLKRIKGRKTSSKRVRLNDNLELSWCRSFPFRLGGSSHYRLDQLISAFSCESGDHENPSAQFILQFRGKVLTFVAESPEFSLYLVNCFEDLRLRCRQDPFLYSRINEYHLRQMSISQYPYSRGPGSRLSIGDDDSIMTSSTTSSIEPNSETHYRSFRFLNTLSLRKRREVVSVQII